MERNRMRYYCNGPREYATCPSPAIALPIINNVVVCATLRMRDPIMKMTTTNINALFTLNIWNTFPHVGNMAVDVKRYAVPYHSPFNRV
jgi:hypothetical protein